MKSSKAVTIVSLSALLLAACGNAPNPPAPPSPPESPQTILGQVVGKAIDQARTEMATSNLTLGRDGGININGSRIGESDQPKAEITPRGDFLIEGRTIPVDDGQRALLLQYRTQVLGIAGAGMSMGTKGADLAGTAIKEAIGGIFNGDGQQVEQRIEAEGKKLEAEAKRLCAQLTPLLGTQARLAASLPEFKPYATLSQSDVDECGKKGGASVMSSDSRDQIQADIRDNIQRSIRTAVQSASVAVGAGNTASVDGVRFLVPSGNLSVDSSGSTTTLDVGNDLKVKLEDGRMWVNGTRYARPAKGTEVDLRTEGQVTVDGKPSYP